MKKGKFPQQVPMGVARCAFWSNLEVHKWMESPDDYVPTVRRVK
jgi:predicted DNA-binding transcriptional regulator AlpA